jgi:hypothetical protein
LSLKKHVNHETQEIMRKVTIGILALCLWAVPKVTADLPTSLTDKVKQGSGTIDLLKDISSDELAGILQSGTLNIGIDINESSAPPESASMQGIAIKQMELILQTSAGTMTFDNFYTNTSASIIENGSQTAQTFATTFGRTGSNGITGGGVSNIDDVIYMSGINLGGATIESAVISMTFVDTATNAGFNEDFFDYSAGFEDLAILDAQTAQAVELSSEEVVASYNSAYSSGSSKMQPLGVVGPAATPEPAWYFLLGGPALLALNQWRRRSEASAS